jgi:predicted phosphodiesterase
MKQLTMEEALGLNSKIGRKQLSFVTGVSEDIARRFLEGQRHPRADSAPANTQVTLKASKEESAFAALSKQEQVLILRGLKGSAEPVEKTTYKWSGNSFKFAHVTDTHWGNMMSKVEHWQRACDLIGKEKCEVILHTGDITDGMSGRPGHYYELDAIGATAQVDMAVKRLEIAPCQVYGISGNHDLWGFKTIGHDVGANIQDRLPGKFFNLGIHEADFQVSNVTIKLWHGEDGSSYATSYRTQKFVEGLSGGDKPHILLSGHAHKSIFHQCRNVMVFEGGTLCQQTMWMRNKKLAAHVGFWIIEIWQNESGLERIKQEWVPFYV